MPKANKNDAPSAFTTNTNTSAQLSHDELKQLSYERREAAQKLTGPGSSRLCKCGKTPFTTVTLGIRPGTAGPARKASYRGLIQCGSVWNCPVCNYRIMLTRRNEIDEAVRAGREKHSFFVTETLTMPHGKNDRLKPLMAKFSLALAANNKDRSVRAVREKFGSTGYVKVLEVPRSEENGWHPHVMYLYFVDRQLTPSELAQWRKVSQAGWRKSLEKQGITHVDAKAHNLDVVRDPNAIAAYMTKTGKYASAQGPGSPANAISGKSGMRTQWDILASYMETESNSDKALWYEWLEGMKGRRFITWSEDLRKSLDLKASPEDKEIVEDDGHKSLVIIDASSVAELVRLPRRQAHYLHLLETLAFHHFLNVLKADGIKYSLTREGQSLLESTRESLKRAVL
jgi:DNA-directed RNA polymerase subunit RPC12/RpoP